MKIETHCHTLYGSGCGLTDSNTIVRRYLEAGYNGVIITNHFYKSAFEEYKGDTRKEKLDFYFSLFDEVKEIGASKGLKVFLGTEIRVEDRNDYLLYGFDRSFLYDNKPLYEYNQKEMFKLADKNGFFFAQAHPFRNGVLEVGDPKFMHGIEKFNGHFHHINNNEKASEFCEKNNLIGLSGTDFHDPDQPITAGIFIPDSVKNETQLVECLFNKNFSLYCDEQGYKDSCQKYFNGEWK